MFFNFGMVAFTIVLPLLMLHETVTSRSLLSYRVAIMGFFMVAGPMVSAGDGKPLRNTDLPVLESNNYKIWAMSFMVMIAAGDKAVHALLKLYEDNGNALPDTLHDPGASISTPKKAVKKPALEAAMAGVDENVDEERMDSVMSRLYGYLFYCAKAVSVKEALHRRFFLDKEPPDALGAWSYLKKKFGKESSQHQTANTLELLEMKQHEREKPSTFVQRMDEANSQLASGFSWPILRNLIIKGILQGT